ncbi:MAG: outer membrane lipoprotein carrier protein LolA [Candidatus Lindowbacteria bacterium]|nr:outer membrane lipoprotein carrier protein LolA [Candidatus Lindowbacteria bacterium]
MSPGSNVEGQGWRNRIILAVLAAVISVFWMQSTCQAGGSDVDGFLKNLEQQRAKVQTYKARFTQKRMLTLFEETKTTTGVVLYKAPRQMIWKYDPPDKTQMRVDRDSVSFYFPDLQQIEVYPSGKGEKGLHFFLAFEASAEALKEGFTISVCTTGSKDMNQIDLFPKVAPLSSEVKSITIWVGKTDFLPRKVVVHELSGDTNEIQFAGARVNEAISDKELQFDAPKGTKVIEASPGAF